MSAEMYFIVAMLAVFSVFGCAGNAVVLYVFSTTKDDLVSTLFIIVLAVVDFSTCLVIIPFTVAVELVSYNVRFDALCKLYQFLITSNIPFSAMIMTAIAFDRYVCICFPFSRLLTLRRARFVVLVLAAFAAVLGITGALTHSVYQRVREVINSTHHDIATLSLPVDWQNRSDDAVYTGYCYPTDLILNSQFAQAFQRCYTAIFVVCLGVVVILYSLIYRSVLRQRRKRQQMKARPSTTRSTATQQRSIDDSKLPARQGGSSSVSVSQAAIVDLSNDKGRSSSERRSEAVVLDPTAAAAEVARRNRIANIKTAAMLFVVTLVFTVCFFPALAMTVYILPYDITVFYVYFANNVANPIIYSFMNTNFRKRLAALFCKT